MLKKRATQRPNIAPQMTIGVPNSTPNGSDQLSYCAARIRNTNTSAMTNTMLPEPSAAFSW
ncbi:hypothetical protein D9M71_519700 [compost metagenome]